MLDETKETISTKERVRKHEENKDYSINISYHNRKEYYSKVLGSKQVFSISMNSYSDGGENLAVIWTTPELFKKFLNKHRDELKVYDRPTYTD